MSIELQNLLERVEKLERNQAHLVMVLKDEAAEKRMATALHDGDLDTVKALVELGIHDVNATVGGRRLFSIAMDLHNDNNRGKVCNAAIANYLLDAGANPLAEDHGSYDYASKELLSMNDPTSVERLELLLRCEEDLKSLEGYRGRGVEGYVVTRAIMSGRTDLIEPRHLEADVNDMAFEVEKKYSGDNGPMKDLTIRGHSSSLKIWLQPMNYLAIFGNDQQFLKAMELGVPAAESSAGYDGYRYESLGGITTVELLEGMGKTQRVLMLRAHQAAQEAHKAIEEIEQPSAGKNSTARP